MSIHIYYDTTDASNPGWAYRDESEGSPLGSGPIDGAAADALSDLYEHYMLSDEQRAAIDHLIDDEIGAPRESVTMQDIGALYPESR